MSKRDDGDGVIRYGEKEGHVEKYGERAVKTELLEGIKAGTRGATPTTGQAGPRKPPQGGSGTAPPQTKKK